MPLRITGKHQVLIMWHKTTGKSLGRMLYWGFHKRGEAGQGKLFMTGYFK